MSRQEFDKFARFMEERQRLRVKRFKQGFITWIILMTILVTVWYFWLYPEYRNRPRPATRPASQPVSQPATPSSGAALTSPS